MFHTHTANHASALRVRGGLGLTLYCCFYGVTTSLPAWTSCCQALYRHRRSERERERERARERNIVRQRNMCQKESKKMATAFCVPFGLDVLANVHLHFFLGGGLLSQFAFISMKHF